MNINEFMDGSGRLGRKDYILWIVITWILGAIIAYVAGGFEDGVGLVTAIIFLIIAIVGIFLGIKRLHDFDKTGWLMLLTIIPLVNLIYAAWPGNPGDNKYGAPNSGTPFPFLHQ